MQDLGLVTEKILLPENLVLLRKGEPALDNILGRPVLLDRELIKVKGKRPGTWSCIFHHQATNLCTIHDRRPAQCRLLECWNTGKITQSYNQNTLSRTNIFKKGTALEELIQIHENQCPVNLLVDLLKEDKHFPGKAGHEIKLILSRDQQFRNSFMEKTGAGPPVLDYYFGRPLTELVIPVKTFLEHH